jgi:hypothetical protein
MNDQVAADEIAALERLKAAAAAAQVSPATAARHVNRARALSTQLPKTFGLL